MEPVTVMVYDRRGQVRSRHRLTSLPATVGRSVTCDVILDDLEVSSVHARLELDGQGRMVLRDAQSRNGLRLGRTKVTEVVFPTTRPVVVGSTRIGVARVSDIVERTETYRISPLERRWLVLPALISVILAQLFSGWLSANEVNPLKLVLEEVVPIVLVLLLWALGWAIASRIAQGVFRYVAHLSIAALALGTARWLTLAIVPAFGFWISAPSIWALVATLVALVCGAWMIGQHLQRTGTWSWRRCFAVGLLVMTMIGVPFQLDQWVKADEFRTALSIPTTALPPALVLHAVKLDDFLKSTEALQQRADGQRSKR